MIYKPVLCPVCLVVLLEGKPLDQYRVCPSCNRKWRK
jgi:hypothetical protein